MGIGYFVYIICLFIKICYVIDVLKGFNFFCFQVVFNIFKYCLVFGVFFCYLYI